MGNKLTNEFKCLLYSIPDFKKVQFKNKQIQTDVQENNSLKSNVLSQSLSSCDRYQDITDFKELFFKDKKTQILVKSHCTYISA